MPRLSGHIAMAVAAAVVIGVLDAAFVAFGIAGAARAFQFVPARIWIVSPLVWMALSAVLCAVVVPLMPRRGGQTVSTVLGVTFVVIRLRGHAALSVSVVIGFAVALTLASRWLLQWTSRPRRRIAFSMTGAAVISALVTMAPSPAAIRHSGGGGDGPNVVLIFLDTVRYDAVFDADGVVRPGLPTLARLRSQGTAFTRAYSTASWTLPSHLSAVTGLPAHMLGVSFDAQRYSRADPTLAERFSRRGYRTAAVISNTFLSRGTGFARGYDTFEQAPSGLDVCRTAPGLIGDTYWPWFSAAVCNWTASDVTRRALRLMHDEDGPFFLTLNYMDAHDPYYVERSCDGTNGYAAAIRCLDRSLAPIVDWRSRRPTIVAVTADHGEQFGEHGLTLHGNSLFVQVLHVPLVVRAGTSSAGQTDVAPISLAALPSLIDGSTASDRGGPALALLLPAETAHLPSQWSATDGRWHLIVRDRGPASLYFLPDDPTEARDLSTLSPSDPAIARLRDAIDAMRREPKPERQKFGALGYIH